MATTLFLLNRASRYRGRACRSYVVHDALGQQRFIARAFRVPGPITIFAPAAPAHPIIVAKPRRSFPITGRYDVFFGDGEEVLGVITRSGRFYDARRRQLGRFHDARTWKQHLGEGVVTAVVEGMIGGEAASADARGADAYQITIAGARAGTLARGRVPFDVVTEPQTPPGRVARALRRMLPKRAGDALFEHRPPYAWKLDVADADGVPNLLLLAAAILAVEIALW